MTLRHAVHHGEAHSCAALALGGEERLETAPPGLRVHADTRVRDLYIDHLGRHLCFSRTLRLPHGALRPHGERAAVGHCVSRVEDEIGKGVANLVLSTHDCGGGTHEVRLQLDDGATLLREITPARLRELEHSADDAIELDLRQRRMTFLRAIELAHAAHGPRHIVNRCLNRRQVRACALAQCGLPLEQRLGVERDRRYRVVDVMRDAARHLSQRAQAFLLHHGLLALAQILVGQLQRVIQLRLVGSQRDVLAQLPQELTVATAEGLRLTARSHEDAEDSAFGAQGRGDQSA